MYGPSLVGNKTYYFSARGNDNGDGSIMKPFRTINKLNQLRLQAGNAVYLHGSDTFDGSILIDASKSGTKSQPIVIRTYGKGNAVINSENETALTIDRSKYIHISNLSFTGSGRKKGNTKDGVIITGSNHISIDSSDISGFQKAGLLVYSSSDIAISHVHAYENGFAGISIEGPYGKKDTRDIYITDCLAENNPGDPSNLNNHSGNGIVVGHSSKVTIEYCVATNNGWDMPRIGNGPVGIWCYEADSIMIQYCISYANKTAKGADDGGGFDLDGGVSWSIIQDCLSYNNQGSAFGIFQYAGASPWHDNIIRNNFSENDGAVSAAHAAAYIWNSSGDEEQFSDLSFYNNILYNAKGAAIHYADKQSKRKGFDFHDNIFVAKDEIITGKVSGDIFSGNTWWSLASGFNVDSTKDFKAWIIKSGKEQKDGKIIGINNDPHFKNAGNTTLTDPHQLKSLMNYRR
ncbi:MAG: right-handed parallel beta-helix repeat-containing protein [Ginsengibacter sp.]